MVAESANTSVVPARRVEYTTPQAFRDPNAHRCEGCPYRSSPTIGSRGPIDAEVAIVGEAPGYMELRSGEPFVGPSGKLLSAALQAADLELDSCFITNSLSCKPPDIRMKTGAPAKIDRAAVDACNARLLRELTASPRKVVLAVGNTALRSLTGTEFGIMSVRGHPFRHKAGFTVLPTVHPAAVLRQGTLLPTFRADLRTAVDISRGQAYDPGVTRYAVVEEDWEVKRALAGLMRRKLLACDIETADLSRWNPLLCVGIAWAKNKVLIFPWEVIERHRAGFKALFENRAIKWLFHNAQFDSSFLVHRGFNIYVEEDTILQHFLLDEAASSHGLKTLAATELGVVEWSSDIEKWLGSGFGGGKAKVTFQIVPREPLYKYLAGDADNTWQLHHRLKPRIEADEGLKRVYDRVLIPATNFLREVEMAGIWIDEDARQRLKSETEAKMATYLAEIKRIAVECGADEGFNPASVKQLRELLYQRLKLKPRESEVKYFKGTTSRLDLERLEPHPFTEALMQYRRQSKAMSTYIKGIEKFIAKDGRVHTTYKLYGTKTGRLSSSKPNLQNITRTLDEEAMPDWVNVKKMFAAPPGHTLIEFDFSQAELRVLAALSGDEALTDIYVNERDLHDEVAAKMFGPNYTKEQRYMTKRVNFGVVYGVTAATLSELFKVPLSVTEPIVSGWFELFPKAKKFLDYCSAHVETKGQIRSPIGRLRRAGLVTDTNRHELMNEFKNFPIQCVASDFTLLAGVYAQSGLKEMGAFIVNLIHDSLLCEVPDDPDTIQRVIKHVTHYMIEVPKRILGNKVPFVAGYKISRNWGDAGG